MTLGVVVAATRGPSFWHKQGRQSGVWIATRLRVGGGCRRHGSTCCWQDAHVAVSDAFNMSYCIWRRVIASVTRSSASTSIWQFSLGSDLLLEPIVLFAVVLLVCVFQCTWTPRNEVTNVNLRTAMGAHFQLQDHLEGRSCEEFMLCSMHTCR